MRHYHVHVRKDQCTAVHTVASLAAVLRLWRTWAPWADSIERLTCYRKHCHPLAEG